MKTYKKNPELIKKHFEALVYLKDKLTTYENYPLTYWKKECGMSSDAIQTVKELEIVINTSKHLKPRWIWNEDIDLNTKLAEIVLTEVRRKRHEYNNRITDTHVKTELKAREIKSLKVGVIRRFLRWIY